MSTPVFPARFQYVDTISPAGEIVYSPEIYGIVSDDVDQLEVMDFASNADPEANVRQAVYIANAINNAKNPDKRSIRAWFEDNVDSNNDWHYHLQNR